MMKMLVVALLLVAASYAYTIIELSIYVTEPSVFDLVYLNITEPKSVEAGVATLRWELPDLPTGSNILIDGPVAIGLIKTPFGFQISEVRVSKAVVGDVVRVMVQYEAKYISASFRAPERLSQATCVVHGAGGSTTVNASMSGGFVRCERVPVDGFVRLEIRGDGETLLAFEVDQGAVKLLHKSYKVGGFNLVNGTGVFQQEIVIQLAGRRRDVAVVEERAVYTWQVERRADVEVVLELVDAVTGAPLSGHIELNGTKHSVNGTARLTLTPGNYVVKAYAFPYLPNTTTVEVSHVDAGRVYTVKMKSIWDFLKENAIFIVPALVAIAVVVRMLQSRRRRR